MVLDTWQVGPGLHDPIVGQIVLYLDDEIWSNEIRMSNIIGGPKVQTGSFQLSNIPDLTNGQSLSVQRFDTH